MTMRPRERFSFAWMPSPTNRPYLLGDVGTLAQHFVESQGVPKERIDEQTRELLRQWHAADAP